MRELDWGTKKGSGSEKQRGSDWETRMALDWGTVRASDSETARELARARSKVRG